MYWLLTETNTIAISGRLLHLYTEYSLYHMILKYWKRYVHWASWTSYWGFLLLLLKENLSWKLNLHRNINFANFTLQFPTEMFPFMVWSNIYIEYV